ncbi:nuclear transport factor 2 family protein [Phenylobacterium sp. LjRoot219]|uniref:nuclear transport factor 2 family protein n=1 Tax=Phenylobacterium sp. LjRoot219 TaxID=3342283 RepID=UPI003ED0E8FF
MAVGPAESAGVVVAGGELDPAITAMDVYLTRPTSAEAPATPAGQAAKAYVELVNAGRFAELPDLFDAAAVILDPAGRSLRGRDEIRGFYEGPIREMRPSLVAVAYVGDAVDCMVALATLKPVNGQPRWVLVSVDHFTLSATGKVARMVAFARAPRAAPEPVPPGR